MYTYGHVGVGMATSSQPTSRPVQVGLTRLYVYIWPCICWDGYVLTADLRTCLGRFKPGVYIWPCSCRAGYVLTADLRTCLGRFNQVICILIPRCAAETKGAHCDYIA